MISIEEAYILSKRYTDRNEIPCVFFNGDTMNMTKDNKKLLSLSFRSANKNFDCTAEMKWQGSSSLAYPKKNLNIKLYTDDTKNNKFKTNFRNWGQQSNFTLKANYIDHSHSRNVVGARLWGDVVRTRENIHPVLETAPNYGAIDGFPIKMFVNGQYQGLYTWNIHKTDYMFNMDKDNPNHAAIAGETNDNGTSPMFRQAALIDGSDWSIEVPDEVSPEILDSFNAMIAHVKDSSDEDFKANFSNYIDLEAAIDYYCFVLLDCGTDGLAKNLIMITYDGVHWIPSMYDLDTTWGIRFDGSGFDSFTHPMEYYLGSNSLLWQRLANNFYHEIAERYRALREGPLSTANIISRFNEFIKEIPESVLAEDPEIYPGLPSVDLDHWKQIRNFVLERAQYADGWIKRIVTRKTADHGFTNLLSGGTVFSAGSLWNGMWDFTVTPNHDVYALGMLADRMVTTGANHLFGQKIEVKPDTDYCFSFYAKGLNPGAKCSVVDETGGKWVDIFWTAFDQNLSNDQYNRTIIPFHTPADCTFVEVFLLRADNTSLDIHVWGAMVNEGTEAPAYTDW